VPRPRVRADGTFGLNYDSGGRLYNRVRINGRFTRNGQFVTGTLWYATRGATRRGLVTCSSPVIRFRAWVAGREYRVTTNDGFVVRRSVTWWRHPLVPLRGSRESMISGRLVIEGVAPRDMDELYVLCPEPAAPAPASAGTFDVDPLTGLLSDKGGVRRTRHAAASAAGARLAGPDGRGQPAAAAHDRADDVHVLRHDHPCGFRVRWDVQRFGLAHRRRDHAPAQVTRTRVRACPASPDPPAR